MIDLVWLAGYGALEHVADLGVRIGVPFPFRPRGFHESACEIVLVGFQGSAVGRPFLDRFDRPSGRYW